MSSFDKTAGKNLDEILASIRKTLADESSEPQPKPPPPTGASDPSPPAASSQNGSKAPIAKIDDDLADLLAGGGIGPTAVPTGPKEAPDAAAEAKDPLWFLRPSGGREPVTSPHVDDPSSPTVDGLAGPVVSPERSSLAALFVADRGSEHGEAYAAAAALASSSPQAKAAPIPDPPSKDAKAPDPTPAPDVALPGKAAPEPFPPPEVAAAGKPTVDAAPADVPAAARPDELKRGPASGLAAGADVAPAPLKPPAPQDQAVPMAPRSPRPAGPESSAPVAAAPGSGRVQGGPGASPIVHSTSPGSRANALNGAAPGASAVPVAQSQALEQIIEQLLEPLLRRWVEVNLPRLVEAAIRAEVARVLEAGRTNGQDIDRKM